MKKPLLIILICFVSVIGALGLAIGGMYLFGGFNEKPVYAQDLYFEESEVVSSENIFLQVSTKTEGINKFKLKLVDSLGGRDIIDFPETINIGEEFRVIPKTDENGNNIGGNVKLTAYYQDSGADPSVFAECNILIDIAVKSAKVNLSTTKIESNGQIIVCNEGHLLTSSLTILPSIYSLVPYNKSGVLGINSVKDNNKALFLEIYTKENIPINDIIYFADGKDQELSGILDKNGRELKNIIQINYSVKPNGDLVFDDTIKIKAKDTSLKTSEFFLRLYTYSTYKDQESNILNDVIYFNAENTVCGESGFLVGGYEINSMQIFGGSTNVEKNVKLNDEIKIYLNNTNIEANDINLGVELGANGSPTISDLDYKYNVYLKIDGTENFGIFTRSDGSSDQESIYGLNINCEDISSLKSNWHWVLNVNNFYAYYNDTPLVATVTYHSGNKTLQKTFNIITTINEASSLEILPDNKSIFEVESGDKFMLEETEIKVNSDSSDEPTFSDVAFYIPFLDGYNSQNISTVPTQTGIYKANFCFNLNELLDEEKLSQIKIRVTDSNWAVIDENRCSFNYVSTSNIDGVQQYVYFAEIELEIKSETSEDILFNIEYSNGVTLGIYGSQVKFFEKDVEGLFDSLPYLTINNVRYFINFDFYTSKTKDKYLKIINREEFGNIYTLSGIGSFKIAIELVYNDEVKNQTFWLGLEKIIQINVYEELKSLVATKYVDQNDYKGNFGNEVYDENSEDLHYIFITSNEIEALKRYIKQGDVEPYAEQIFAGIDISNYPGINKNKDAISFGEWFEVKENNVVVGFVISYKINAITSIEIIDNQILDNLFRISVSIYVNNSIGTVYAEFKTDDNSNNKYLDVEITDKILRKAVVSYDNPSSTYKGLTKETAIELRADILNDGSLSYGDSIDRYLTYYLAYNADDKSGVYESMAESISVADESGVDIVSLYSFTRNFNEGVGRGGLTFRNFPVIYDDKNSSVGVLVSFTIYSHGEHDFNTHYVYKDGSFVLEQNDNLSSTIYFRIYGIDFTIEANKNAEEVYGFKDNVISFFNSDNALFNVSAKSGNGNTIANIKDYSQIFSTFINGENVTFVKNDNNETDYTRLTVNKDLLSDSDIYFSFYVSFNRDNLKNQVKIKVENGFLYDYNKKINSAYDIEENLTFDAPSTKNQQFIKITYHNNKTLNLNDVLKVSIKLTSHTLSSEYAIDEPITIINNNNIILLSLKVVPVSFNASFNLEISKVEDENDKTNKNITIKVNSLISEEDLTIGSFDETENMYFITAGVNQNLAIFSDKLNSLLTSNSSSTIDTNGNKIFEDVGEYKDTTPNANAHMKISFSDNKLSVSSGSLNENKIVKVTITINFSYIDDGKLIDNGKFIFVKTLLVKPNLQLEFRDAYKEIKSGKTLNLTNANIYKFTDINGGTPELDFTSNFVYDNLSSPYNNKSFVYSNNFKDVSNTNSYLSFIIGLNYGTAETKDDIIGFYYVTENGYKLYFELEIKLVISPS